MESDGANWQGDGWTPPFAGIFRLLHLCRETSFCLSCEENLHFYTNTIEGEKTK